MELKAKGDYHSGLCSLYEGNCTDQLNLPEEVKAQMLADHPDLFEVVGGKAPAAPAKVEEPVVENQEDKMDIDTPEGKMSKTRKK